MRNCTEDEGGPFEFGNQVLISSHRKLLWSKAMVASVAERSDSTRRMGPGFYTCHGGVPPLRSDLDHPWVRPLASILDGGGGPAAMIKDNEAERLLSGTATVCWLAQLMAGRGLLSSSAASDRPRTGGE
jgi:hypothetical protein